MSFIAVRYTLFCSLLLGVFLGILNVSAQNNLSSASSVVIAEIYPNVIKENDDEYIILENISCETLSLNGFSLIDASGKSYTLSGDILPYAKRKISYGESRIALNNTTETLDLRNTNNEIIDAISYTKTIKGVPIIYPHTPVVCSAPASGVSESGSSQSSQSGEVSASLEGSDTGSIAGDTSGSGSGEGSPSSLSGSSLSSGSLLDVAFVLSGGVDNGSEGIISSDMTSSGGSIDSLIATSGSVSISTQTGSPSSSSGFESSLSDSGSLTSSGSEITSGGASFAPPEWSGSLHPIFLKVQDTNSDSRYDQVVISYNEDLSGSIDTTSLMVTSATGGLLTDRAYEGSSLIGDARVEGNTVIVRLLRDASVLHDMAWKVNKTPASHFRIKGKTPFLQGKYSRRIATDLTLTVMLDGYNASYISLDAIGTTPMTPQAGASSVTTNTGTSNTRATETGVTHSTATPVGLFPLNLRLQYPSNATISDTNILCHTPECRTNFEATLSGSTLSNCQYVLDGEIISSSCNPPSFTLSQPSAHHLRFSGYDPLNRLYSAYFDWQYIPEVPESEIPPVQSTPTKQESQCFQSSSSYSGVTIAGVNPSPSKESLLGEYISLRNHTAENISLCGCYIERETVGKGGVIQLKESRHLQAILLPGRDYILSSRESGLTLPKEEAKLRLVCGESVRDTFSYFGNHTSDILLTSELLSGQLTLNNLLQKWRQKYSPQEELPSQTPIEREEYSWISLQPTDELFLGDLDPILLWSVSASSKDLLTQGDDSDIYCHAFSPQGCRIRGDVFGLSSAGEISWSVGTGVMSEWQSRNRFTIDLPTGDHSIRVRLRSRDTLDETLYESIDTIVHVTSELLVNKRLKGAKKISKKLKAKRAKVIKKSDKSPKQSARNSLYTPYSRDVPDTMAQIWLILFALGALTFIYILSISSFGEQIGRHNKAKT